MERGDVYLVSLDPTSGREQQGTRPVLIVSATAFNRLTRTPVVLPITSGGNFARSAGFAVSLMGAGTQTTGVVRCDQPRTLDLGARHGRKLEVCHRRSSIGAALARRITGVLSYALAPRPACASASASLAPTSALCLTSAMLVARLRPPVSALMRASRKGVTALPVIPCALASASAC